MLLKWKQSLIYVLEGKLRTQVMQKVHDVPMAGHSGEKMTKEFLGKTFYWLEMKDDIKHYVRKCVKCQTPS
jgi:Mor family transcriptional regulator